MTRGVLPSCDRLMLINLGSFRHNSYVAVLQPSLTVCGNYSGFIAIDPVVVLNFRLVWMLKPAKGISKQLTLNLTPYAYQAPSAVGLKKPKRFEIPNPRPQALNREIGFRAQAYS